MTARDFINKIKKEYGLTSDEELALKLGISKYSIDKWIQRDKIPDKWQIILGQKPSLTNHHGIQIANNSTINGNITINTSLFNHSEDIKEIVELLQFAPIGFLKQVKERLQKFKELSQI